MSKETQIRISNILKVVELELIDLSKDYYKDKYNTQEYFNKCDNVMNVARLKIESIIESEADNENN